MRQHQNQVFVSYLPLLLLALACLVGSSKASLLPFIDRPGSLLSDPWADLFPDPSRVLEQIPFGLDRDESMVHSSVRVDWKETPEGHVILMDVPGLSRNELKIEVMENRMLRVRGQRKREEEKKGDHWHRVERSYGKFWRQFKLPDDVDLDSLQAKLENGVLTLSLKKLSSDKIKGPRVVNIVGGEDEATVKLKNEDKQEL